MHVLPEPLHRELRLDRNRYAITADEQERLTGLRVAVAGLSVGRAVVSTMAHEGIGGELRLADFDVLDLSNLNRVAGGVADVGVSKVVLAAREVAELDPYIRVVAYPGGVEETTIADVRRGRRRDRRRVRRPGDEGAAARARARRRPARRHGHEPSRDARRRALRPRARPAGRSTGCSATSPRRELGGLTTKQKVPYVIRILDPASLTDRAAASMVEVKETVSTWPQLASDVALGGAMVANAVRRIALGELTASGRFYADLDELTADGRQAPLRRRPADARSAARRRCRRPAPARHADGGPLRRRLRELGAVRRQHAAVALRGATANVIRAWVDPTALVAAGLPRPRRAARARRRAGGGRDRRPRARLRAAATLPADGPVWELALERIGPTSRRGAPPGSCGSAAATAAPAPRRRSRRTRSRGSPASARRCVTRPRQRRARRARRRPGRARPRALPLAAAAPRPDRRAALHGRRRRRRRDRRRLARARRADLAAMDVLRTGAGMDLLAGLDRGWGLANASRDAFAARPARSCCAPRHRPRRARRRRPRAHAAVARGDAPAAGRPSVGLAVPLPAPARGRRLAGGTGSATALTDAAAAFGAVVAARPRAGRSCSSCACRGAPRRRRGRCAARSTRCSAVSGRARSRGRRARPARPAPRRARRARPR